MKKKIYISGKITGLPEDVVIRKFKEAENIAIKMKFEPISPLNINHYPSEKSWKECMVDDIRQLMDCDYILFFN